MMGTKVYNYLKLVKLDTSYAKKMERLSNRIFGNPLRPITKKQDMINHTGVVDELKEEPVDKQDRVRNWYPRHRETHKLVMALRDYGLFRDEHEDFREEIKRQKALRGKAERKPGQGGKKAKISG
ncbi:unnamed protein product [Orchesella dallaii]|uniref:Small ribosomal subunit protein mS33 n=1 Tax=Orchesella dallaii TaxID=48710 RepID=A0ABP1QFT9_9HEXA